MTENKANNIELESLPPEIRKQVEAHLKQVQNQAKDYSETSTSSPEVPTANIVHPVKRSAEVDSKVVPPEVLKRAKPVTHEQLGNITDQDPKKAVFQALLEKLQSDEEIEDWSKFTTDVYKASQRDKKPELD